MAINSVGQVAGSSQTPNGYIHAFRASDGIFEDLGTLGGAVSYAYGLNGFGDVVGSSYIGDHRTFTHFYIRVI